MVQNTMFFKKNYISCCFFRKQTLSNPAARHSGTAIKSVDDLFFCTTGNAVGNGNSTPFKSPAKVMQKKPIIKRIVLIYGIFEDYFTANFIPSSSRSRFTYFYENIFLCSHVL